MSQGGLERVPSGASDKLDAKTNAFYIPECTEGELQKAREAAARVDTTKGVFERRPSGGASD